MKFLKKKIILVISSILLTLSPILIILIIIIGAFVGGSVIEERNASTVSGAPVINSQLYAERYRNLLNKYLLTKGYVSLERMVFYLQRTHNVLDTSKLKYDEWEKAYLENVNVEEKQMMPIKTVCKSISKDNTLPKFTITNGVNENGFYIDVIDLCSVNGDSILDNDDYSEYYYPQPYIFPLKRNFNITSIVFEHRNIDFGLSAKEQASVNFHSGWDFSVPIGTNFYSVCDGVVDKIVNTQIKDVPFKQSNNQVGNYMTVKCTNGLKVSYNHLQYKSQPFNIKEGILVKSGDLLGRTSTTGRSTGGHLHLGLSDNSGKLLDALVYIDLKKYKED